MLFVVTGYRMLPFVVFLRGLIGAPDAPDAKLPDMPNLDSAHWLARVTEPPFLQEWKDKNGKFCAVRCKICNQQIGHAINVWPLEQSEVPLLNEHKSKMAEHMQKHLCSAELQLNGKDPYSHQQITNAMCKVGSARNKVVQELFGVDDNGDSAGLRHMFPQTERSSEEISGPWSWFNFFELVEAVYNEFYFNVLTGQEGRWQAPPLLPIEKRRMHCCQKLMDLSLTKHVLTYCPASICDILNSIESRIFGIDEGNGNLVLHKNTLSWMFIMMSIATIPSPKQSSFQDTLYLVFDRLIELEVQRIATECKRQPALIFGVLYKWLLRGMEGLDAKNLSTWELFKIAVGRYCRMRYHALYSAEESALMRELLSLY